MKICSRIYLKIIVATILVISPSTSWSESSLLGGFQPQNMGTPKRLVGGGTRGLLNMPDTEVRSVIQEVDGYAYLGENTTIKQARRMAILEAKRSALESAETYIKSKTKVTDGILDFDVIESETGGKVTILKQKDNGLKNGRYHVWIKAEVKWGLKPSKSEESQVTKNIWQNPQAPLTVRVWTNNKVFQKGEKIVLFLTGNRDFYARVVDKMSDGTIVQILPNSHRQNNFFRGGVVYKIPDSSSGDQFEMDVVPPFGVDRIIVYASDAPLGSISTQNIGQGLQLFQGTESQLSRGTRGIKIQKTGISETKTGASTKKAEFIESSWEIRTIDN
ncbi:MAG: DUF4384 domain-containing protein [Magnetococcales bacterium]|nr:DUF4384 domain-containing protein [Magnetococcales bacterium]